MGRGRAAGVRPAYAKDEGLDPLAVDPVEPDDGCEYSPSCLACPLPKCKYDMPTWHQSTVPNWYLLEQKLKPLLAKGMTSDEIAAELGVSRRTVMRLRKFPGHRAFGVDP